MVERTLIFGNKGMIPFALALAVVLGVIIVYLYRTERRMIRRRAGLVLTLLRLALLVVLLMMLTEPIVSITTTEPRRGTLILLVDNSRSMQIPDPGRPSYEKLRLADALGLLPEGFHRSGLAVVREDLANLLAKAEATAHRWNDFAEVMSLGVIEDAERTERLDETLTDTQGLRKSLAGVAEKLDADRAGGTLPGDVAVGVAQLETLLAEVNTAILDEIIREVGGVEFRARPTVGRLRGVNQNYTRAVTQLSQALTRIRELVVKHDTILADAALKAASIRVQEIEQATRLELAARVLTDPHVNFVPRLAGKYRLRGYLFARRSNEFPITTGDNGTSARVEAPDLPEDALYTDLSDSLQQAARAMEGEEIGGVIIVSDGRFNRGEDPLGFARILGARGIPLYPVTVGSEVSPRDIAVVKVNTADVVHEKDSLEAGILVKASGFQGQELSLSVLEGARSVAEQKFTVPEGSDRTLVKVTFVPEGKGQHTYVVTVPHQSREVFVDNNEKEFAVSVLDRKLQVLMVDGGPRWEYRYLKNALLRDKRIDLKYILFNPLTTSQEERKRAAEAYPHKREELFACDTVIFGDVDPATFTIEDLTNLEAFVSDRGGTLLVIAGRNFMPAAYGKTPLGLVLPVVPAEDAPPDGKDLPVEGFTLKLTTEAQQSPIFRLSPDEKENLETWADLPKMMWYAPVKEVKPGAVVWAWAQIGEGSGGEGTSPQWKRPVIVSQSCGLGRVFYMGTDNTWRWRYKVADKYFHQFWGQVILWATSGKLPTGTERVKLGTDKYEYLDGEDVIVRARVLSEKMLPVSDAMVSAVLLNRKDDSVVAKTRLDCLVDSGGHYEGKFLGIRTGDYVVKLTIPGMDQELSEVVTAVKVKAAPTRELVELSADGSYMEELAVRSGGRSFTLDDFGRLPDVLRPLKWKRVYTREVPLWSHWLLLLVFCAIVTVEWVLRKAEGLL